MALSLRLSLAACSPPFMMLLGREADIVPCYFGISPPLFLPLGCNSTGVGFRLLPKMSLAMPIPSGTPPTGNNWPGRSARGPKVLYLMLAGGLYAMEPSGFGVGEARTSFDAKASKRQCTPRNILLMAQSNIPAQRLGYLRTTRVRTVPTWSVMGTLGSYGCLKSRFIPLSSSDTSSKLILSASSGAKDRLSRFL